MFEIRNIAKIQDGTGQFPGIFLGKAQHKIDKGLYLLRFQCCSHAMVNQDDLVVAADKNITRVRVSMEKAMLQYHF